MHSRLNRYFALMAPIINPPRTASPVQSLSGLMLCASSSSLELLKESTTAPLYQTRDASNFRVRVEVLYMSVQCNTTVCERGSAD